MKYRLLVFDFDGTLADSESSILEALRLVAMELALPGVDRENARRGIGLPLHRTIEMGLGLAPQEAADAVERYKFHFKAIACDSARLFPGVRETLDMLRRDYLLAVASSKSTLGLTSMMRHFGIIDWFSCIAGAQDVLHPKPAPDMVQLALDTLGIPADQCLVVGDTVYDIEMGRRASADTCAVTYGTGSVAELRKLEPTWMIDTFSELPACLTA